MDSVRGCCSYFLLLLVLCVLFVLDKRAAGGFPIANEKGESSIIEFSTTLSERFMGERKLES